MAHLLSCAPLKAFTDSTMKRLISCADSTSAATQTLFPNRAFLLPVALYMILFGLTSCIFEAPGDRFYRTLWVSEDFNGKGSGDCPGEKITLEFLCGGSVTVISTGAIGSYGTYEFHEATAYFANLRITYLNGDDPIIVVLEEAHRTDDLLLISWHYYGSDVSYITRMVRKNTYE